MEFYISECAGPKPAEVDTESSCTATYIRRNFVEIEADEENDRPAGWQYEETKLSKAEYATYIAAKNEEQLSDLSEYLDVLTEMVLGGAE